MIARFLFVASLAALAACGFGTPAAAQPAPAPGTTTSPPPSVTPPPIPTAPPSSIPQPIPTTASIGRMNLDADSVALYYDRYLIEADGDVRLRLEDGTLLTGDTFSMDLRLNRFLIAGHVRLTSGSVTYAGAAFSEYLDDDRGYFIPLLGAPDRWTFIGGDYAVPYLGREMPGDVFFLPNLTNEKPYLLASSATIWPRDAMMFHRARFRVAGTMAPAGNLYFNFSANPNFHQNSLVGASVDVGYPFAGGKYEDTTLHARYDQTVGPYLGIEQHFAWDNAYIVASVNPFDRAAKQYNLLASDRFSRNFELDDFSQLNVVQDGWTTPFVSSYFGSYAATAALKRSFLKLTFNQYNDDLLADPPPDPVTGEKFYGNPSYVFDPTHPVNATLQWTGFDHPVGRLPLYFRLRSGLATYHNGYGLGSFAGTEYDTLWSSFYGATLYTQSLRVAPNTYVVGTFDKQRTFYSLPHHLDTETTTVSASRLLGTKAAFSLTYQVTNSGDYAGPYQLALYPPSAPINPATGLPDIGYLAFDGFATSRALSWLATFTPKPNVTYSVNYAHYDDFPAPVGTILGRPPNYLNFDVKMRLTPQLSLELSRAYYFNWYGAKWAPQMGIQLGP